jgi:hypothetical protein
MKKALVAVVALIAMGAAMAPITEANAVVCARGVYRAGCAGPYGAVGVRRAPYYAAPRGAVVVRRPYGARVYRRY